MTIEDIETNTFRLFWPTIKWHNKKIEKTDQVHDRRELC